MTEADVPAQVLPCLVCGQALESAFGTREPVHATMFNAGGNYGSGVFDPMAGASWLSVNVCDQCLTAAAGQGRVHHLTEQVTQRPEPEVVLWTAEPEDLSAWDGEPGHGH